MTRRRTMSSRAARRVRSPLPVSSRLNSSGEIRSLVIIVDKATLATTIIPVEAEKPPMNTSSARASLPAASGSAITIMSALVDCGRTESPASTIGTMTSDVTTR